MQRFFGFIFGSSLAVAILAALVYDVSRNWILCEVGAPWCSAESGDGPIDVIGGSGGTEGDGTGSTSSSRGGTSSAGVNRDGTTGDESGEVSTGSAGTAKAKESSAGTAEGNTVATNAGGTGTDREGDSEPNEVEQRGSITRLAVNQEDSGPAQTAANQPSVCVDVSPIRDGDLISLQDEESISQSRHDDIYVTKVLDCKAFKRLILSPAVMEAYGHLSFVGVSVVTESAFNKFKISTLVRLAGYDDIYHLRQTGSDDGERHLLNLPAEVLEQAGLDLDSAFVINEAEFYIWRRGEEISTAGELSEVLSQQGGS